MISDLKKKIHNLVETNKTDKIISNNNNNNNNNENLYVYPIDYEYITKFRKQKIEERIKISQNIISKYPQRVPIIVDCKKDINLDKNKS